MERFIKIILKISFFSFLLTIIFSSNAGFINHPLSVYHQPPDSTQQDSGSALPYPFTNETGGLYLNNPPNVTTNVEYNPETNEYTITEQVGDNPISPPQTMSFEEYQQYDIDNALKNYWREKNRTTGDQQRQGLIPQIHVGGEVFDKIFGSSTIDIRPQGSFELIFGINSVKREDPSLDVRQRKTTNFDFDMKIQMNVTAKIGDKIDFGVNYNTEAMFDFENKMKLAYEGEEDDIIKLIEAGDVTLPLPGSLITGSQTLFGIKTQLQFGRATVTSVFSQQKSETSTIEVSGGAQVTNYEVKADQYEENRHYFISHFFRDNFNTALNKLPIIGSNIIINKIEVWRTNIGPATTENRNIVAFMDLGESNPHNPTITPYQIPLYPDNNKNSLYGTVNNPTVRDINLVSSYLSGGTNNFVAGEDFEKVENARLLSANEYTFNSKLGFISLNSSLNADEVLAVAFQYTVLGDTTTYQVGDFSNQGIDAPQALVLKLLKSTAVNTSLPMWDLMMKNVYAIGAFRVNPEEFRLHILYTSDEAGIPTNYISESNISGQPLIRVLNLDNLNTQLDPISDGVFDFIDNAATNGGTIESRNGRIYFPILEPFGNDLRTVFGSDTVMANKYVYEELYRKTKTEAQQFPDKNRFLLGGYYKSDAGSEISLNAMNVPQGSVKVTSGGIMLTENVDYTVDYTLGRVKIINEGILNSGAPIQISLESQSMFNLQTKTLTGTHVDYVINKNFNVGATIMNLRERPLTQKVNYGSEPISNTIWGLNLNYETESRFITTMVDKLPFISTKAPSRISFMGEFAHLIPGHSKAIGKTGTSYVDDFEGSKSTVDLKNVGAWFLASTPQNQTEASMFPEAAPASGLRYGFNRAHLAWYVIDPLFFRNNNLTPQHIKDDINQQSNHFVREILETEVFPNKETPHGQPMNIAVLNMAYYPSDRGMYNFDAAGVPGVSRGINADGTLKDPNTRWGGIMRSLQTTDFEATNVEHIEFWLMDPFVYDPNHTGGQLYFNLGDVSEDVLRDGRKSFENGLPTSDVLVNVDSTIWGLVPAMQALVNTFDNNPASREFQDVGLDGLRDEVEIGYHAPNEPTYLELVETLFGTSSAAYQNAQNDPSGDNYSYFRGTDHDQNETSILNRYKRFNGVDGNSPTADQSPESYPTSATTLPNTEDINRDNTLSETERYYQYIIDLHPNRMNVGENYITDVYPAVVTLKNGDTETINWYQFKIPVRSPDKVVGNIEGFNSIRFMRVFFKGFTEPIFCRFATLELVRGQWRKYNKSLLSAGEYVPSDGFNETSFDVSTVNIEENGKRTPVPYVIPPGIEREINLATTNLQKLNEQALSLNLCNLQDGDARAVYKTADLDVRMYKRFRMFVHAEKGKADEALNDGEVTVFVRLGTDFNKNYYEYEIPLKLTPWYTSATELEAIWPLENEFDFPFTVFQEAKIERNTLMRLPNSEVLLTTPFTVMHGENKVIIVGNPTLSNVKTIMIGVRNPKKSTVGDGDDGQPKCVEVWVNEMRLTDFDDQGGWAANARLQTGLADLGTFTVAGFISTPGFGSIDKKVAERQKETITQYDFATNLELGKFFPESTGIRIPMHFDYSKMISTPQYNPLNPDIIFADDLETYPSEEDRDSIKAISRELTQRRSINFMNVRKDRVGSTKTRLYDIENFDFTYAYTEINHSSFDVIFDNKKTYKGALGYNFSTNPKNVSPFSRSAFLRKYKFLALIRDFNFYYMPKTLSFRTDLDRLYNETLLRDKTQAKLIIEPNYVKAFDWNRSYNMRFDLTRSLNFDFAAMATARIDEPQGRIDKDDDDYNQKRDTIISNIKDFGRITSYNQTLNANYNIPINKLPLLNWVSANARYTGTFNWAAAPLSTIELGNTIQNSNNKQLNLNANMTSLYNMVPYLKKLNQPVRTQQPGRVPIQPQEVENSDSTQKESIAKIIIDNTLKILMAVKNASINYSENNGTLMPGFLPSPVALGQDWNIMAPGSEFVFGGQRDIRGDAVKGGWLTADTLFNSPFVTTHTKTLSARSTIEPLPGFRIELTANRNESVNKTEYFKADATGEFKTFSPMETGNFSISYITWNTAWDSEDKETHASETFEAFKNYRIEIANRLAQENPNWDGQYVDTTGFPTGYGPTSQEVLIPAFLAAYTGANPKSSDLSTFPKIPLPNWRITYDGLTKIKFIAKYLQTLRLSHAYRSSYNVGSFTSNIQYREDEFGHPTAKDLIDNFIAKSEINQISISEQYSPLISFDMTWHNSLITKFEIKKSRNLAMSFANNQLTETKSDEYVIGAGYRIPDVEFSINTGNRSRNMKSDLNMRADLSIRENKTVLRKLVENFDQISTGQRIISINVSVDYMIDTNLMVRLFYDRIITDPFVSTIFPNSNTNAGFSLRFTLAP
ncbi:MAG: cell surface protein SprA [Bacteroidales bacterium]|nr:cell surface protein SprA [Bacteroidales bacterium]